jgi:predicted metal-dependent enzyme (double-stranded beta helix superfamily)
VKKNLQRQKKAIVQFLVEMVLVLDAGLDESTSVPFRLMFSFDKVIQTQGLAAQMSKHKKVETTKWLLGVKPSSPA